jgi:hypothetical protein
MLFSGGWRDRPFVSLFAALALGLLTLPASGQAQEGPSPADRRAVSKIDGAALQPGTVAYSGGGALTQTITATTTAGRETWTIVRETRPAVEQAFYDSLVVDRETLLPRFRLRREAGQTLRLSFGQDTVTGTLTTGSETREVDVDAKGPVLASRAHALAALQTLSIEPDLSVRFPVLMLAGEATVEYEVVGTETVETPAGEQPVYVVESTTEFGGNTFKRTVYCRQQQPHRVVKVVPDGMDGPLLTLTSAGGNAQR